MKVVDGLLLKAGARLSHGLRMQRCFQRPQSLTTLFRRIASLALVIGFGPDYARGPNKSIDETSPLKTAGGRNLVNEKRSGSTRLRLAGAIYVSLTSSTCCSLTGTSPDCPARQSTRRTTRRTQCDGLENAESTVPRFIRLRLFMRDLLFRLVPSTGKAQPGRCLVLNRSKR